MATPSSDSNRPHSSISPSHSGGGADPPNLADVETVFQSQDSSKPEAGQKDIRELPKEFGRYQILRKLGRGGMGVVYLAHDVQLDRDVALKVPHFDRGETPEVIERFLREARSMATLRHPNLCPIYDVGEHEGIHFLTMAFIEGQELSTILKDAQTASRLDVVDLVRKVALALGEAHQAGLVHRDLKPSNIMIDQRGEPIVMDFGLARRDRHGEAEITQTGVVIGTPAYMPPEQISGDAHSIGPTADVYSLGVILYQLLCNHLPFEGEFTAVLAQVMSKEPNPPSRYCEVDPALESICLTAMAKAPQERFRSMEEFVAVLTAYQTSPEHTRARVRRKESANRPALVPGFRHDVFIAYVASDDEPPPGGESVGWVTALIDNLDWRLRQLFGQGNPPSVWMDEALAQNPQFDEEQSKRLTESATVLLIVSPGWKSSTWFEPSSRFLEPIRKWHFPERNVFLVERDRMDPGTLPEEIASLRSIPFWAVSESGRPRVLGYPHPQSGADADYYARIDDLARALNGRISEMVSRSTAEPSRDKETVDFPAPPSGMESVYLAEVTDDLDSLRDEVARYLDQSGFRVFPQSWYLRDVEGFRRQLQEELRDSLIFVQLLGPFPGKKPPGSDHSYAKLQYDLAVESGLPILQWREGHLILSSISDPEHRALVDGLHVQAVELESFKRDILSRAKRERQKRQTPAESGSSIVQDQAFIFINIEKEDLGLADDLCDLLERSGYSYALPMREGRPDEIRQDLEANLLDCDGLIVVYGEITEQWVREQLRQWRKMLFRREKPLRALAVYEGPPSEKQRLGMKLPKMHVIDCRQGLQEEKVKGFLSALS